jgi:acyl-CoA synthetase (AMP-forming)/AMP-acid ligase II
VTEPLSILDVLDGHARSRPDHDALVIDDGNGAVARWTYGELDRAVRRLAARLAARGLAGQPVGLLFGPGDDFILAFFACLSIGGVAVPLAPIGRRRERVRNLLPIAIDCAPAAILLDAGMAVQYADLGAALAPLGIACLQFDALMAEPHDGEWTRQPIGRDDLAVLQYTSGSTSEPKGVMISHGNIMANQAMIQAAFGHDSRSDFVGWAPHFHDQGLFGNILQPLYLGATCVLAAPATFVRRPLVWLELIDRYRAHTSGGPNFAYEMVVEHAALKGLPDVDLSCWKVAFNGAEPIHARSVVQFAETFAPVGFDRKAFFPCYGLAECTVVAVCGPRDTPPVLRQVEVHALGAGHATPPGEDGQALSVVCCGPAMEGGEALIVDPATRTPAAFGEVGEIWLAGPHIGGGYWRRAEASAETFGAHLADGRGPYLRTGDLGFEMPEGFYIVGRMKDLLIVRGRNYAPTDIEQIWPDVIGHAGQAIAAAFQLDMDGRTHVVLVAEVDRATRLLENLSAAVAGFAMDVRAKGLERLDLSITDLVVVAPGAIPRTTSGKVRRSATREMLLEGQLPVLGDSGTLMRKLDSSAKPDEQGLHRCHA